VHLGERVDARFPDQVPGALSVNVPVSGGVLHRVQKTRGRGYSFRPS
jgi:hypothetical protein